jgi:hypothetical protein
MGGLWSWLRKPELQRVVLRWVILVMAGVVVHWVCESVHHTRCRRSIFHVMFWKKSHFCTTLEHILKSIEAVFDGAHAQLLTGGAEHMYTFVGLAQ